MIFHRLVRLKAYYLINRHAPLLANTSVNSLGFNLTILLPGRNIYRVSLDTGNFPTNPKFIVYSWPTRVSNPVYFSRFRALASEFILSVAPAPLVVLSVYMDITPTQTVPNTSTKSLVFRQHVILRRYASLYQMIE